MNYRPDSAAAGSQQRVDRCGGLLDEVIARYRAAASHVGATNAQETLATEFNATPITHVVGLCDLLVVAVSRLAEQTDKGTSNDNPGRDYQ